MTAPVPISVAEVLIQLSEHIDAFADDIPRLVKEGDYWWFRPSDNTFRATAARRPGAPGDFYLYYASPDWKAFWAGDWDAAAMDLINALDAALNRPVQP